MRYGITKIKGNIIYMYRRFDIVLYSLLLAAVQLNNTNAIRKVIVV